MGGWIIGGDAGGGGGWVGGWVGGWDLLVEEEEGEDDNRGVF